MFCNKMLRLQQLYRTASLLALVTIFYNMAEGVVSAWFGASVRELPVIRIHLKSGP